MKNNIDHFFLSPLIETEKFRNVLLVGNLCDEVFRACFISVSNIGGSLIVSADQAVKFDNRIIYCDKNSTSIFPILQLKKIKLDLLLIEEYIDGIEKILNVVMKKKGLIIVKKSLSIKDIKKIGVSIHQIFETKDYFFFITKNNKNLEYYKDIEKRLLSIEEKIQFNVSRKKPIVGVGVLTYNHKNYIQECLNGIFKQKGDFQIQLLIIDDFSSDGTEAGIEEFLESNTNERIKVQYIKNSKNTGMIYNLKVLMNFFKDTDYFTFCEGDDYWISDFRIQKFINYMKLNPFVSVAFNSIYLYSEREFFKKNENHFSLVRRFYNTRDLINKSNLIGNFSCCFYNSSYLDGLKEDAYHLTLYDLLFNAIYSNYGFIGHLGEYLSVYRYHENSVWSSKKELQKSQELYACIDQYNQYSNFTYDIEYRKFQDSILKDVIPNNFFDKDLVIIDNVFPNELSQFSYQEITSYLDYYEKSICLSTGLFFPCFNNSSSLDEAIRRYKRSHLDLHTKVIEFNDDRIRIYHPKLLYFIFLSSVKLGWSYILEKKRPFVFELYPGGGFAFDNPESDYILKTVMSSKYFKKVIVTQSVVRDYLLKKKFCKPHQIEYIFGVVMPLESLKKDYEKCNYGIDKKSLDIVFMAHKYTERGVDKGYDIFIDVAKKLSKKYSNIYFHVVGGFSEDDIDISGIKKRIKFYGSLPGNQLDQFFLDKDIIVSPNIPNQIFPGSFDGFPTASCTEAGLRKTAIFCTDPLLMNHGIFEDQKEIEIIEHDVDNIVNRIDYYYHHPNELKKLGQNGSNSIKKVYGYDRQIKSRIEVLNKVLGRKK